MSLWLDTSVLVSLYVPEPRSERAARLVRRIGESISFSQLHELEVANALRLRLFRREATIAMVEATLARISEDRDEGVLVRVAVEWSSALATALELANRHTARLGARSLDLLHVAAALTHGARRFVTADGRQATVSRRAGLSTTRIA